MRAVDEMKCDVLPKSVRQVVGDCAAKERNPSLFLDVLHQRPEGQKENKPELAAVTKCTGDTNLLTSARAAYFAALRSLPGRTVTFCATKIGPLTLHLSRAGSLENAGICLHRTYGFTYLPGSGLKGLARAFAESVWLPQQGEVGSDNWANAWQDIETVFGWAPNKDRKDDRIRAKHWGQKCPTASTGAVIFHDAWPLQWPQLVVDITTSHHKNYYGSNGSSPPGDWEEPNPVSFLAVDPKPDLQFRMALTWTQRAGGGADFQPAERDRLFQLAQSWLIGGMEQLGVGAKTNAGYGSFRVELENNDPVATEVETLALDKDAIQRVRGEDGKEPTTGARRIWTGAIGASGGSSALRAEFSTTLELVTPAFLAGASQDDPKDCDLRPATLRGQLRWWWRTMHAAWLSPQELYQLESAIWGSTEQGGAVRIVVERVGNPEPKLFRHKVVKDGKLRAQPEQRFKDAIGVRETASPIAGMYYLSFGMDDNSKVNGQEVRKSRHRIEPPAGWGLRVSCRPSKHYHASDKKRKHPISIPLQQIKQQAAAALWLLTTFGGVGAKSRKGFGSLMTGPIQGLNEDEYPARGGSGLPVIRKWSESLRKALNLPKGVSPTASIDNMVAPLVEKRLNHSPDKPWPAIEELGGNLKIAVSDIQNKVWRGVLGLPRGEANSLPTDMIQEIATEGVSNPFSRYASSACFHFSKTDDGKLALSAMFFRTGNSQSSKEVLTGLGKHLEDSIRSPAPVVKPGPKVELKDPLADVRKDAGVIIGKPNGRTALVKMDDGREVTAKGAKPYNVGDRVQVKEGAGSCEIIGKA